MTSRAVAPANVSPVVAPVRRHPSLPYEGIRIVLLIAIAQLAVHCYFNSRYGYFRDEFDFLSCSDHLAWGYVDHPPLTPFLVHITRLILGDSLRALRFFPAFASAALVVIAALLAHEFGGRRYALSLTAICVAFAPIYLAYGSLVTTNALEPLLWMGCALCAVRAVGREDPRYWFGFGVIAGIGMEEKYGIAVFVLGIVIGLLLTPQRRAFTSRWIWLGALATFLLFLPNLLWNIHHHWPFLELMRNVRASGRDVVLSPFDYFGQQFLMVQPVAGPIWILGLLAFFAWSRLRPWRFLGWCYLVAFTVFVLLQGKNYYLAPVYPMLLAAGPVLIENGILLSRQYWLRPVIATLIVAEGLWIAPLVIPVLPVEWLVAFVKVLPFKIPRPENRTTEPLIPQHYADQFGWQEIVDEVNLAWKRIPAAERADCGIFAQNYGQAGAIDFLGHRYNLPPALSGHQSFFLWGPRGYSGKCLIVVDGEQATLEKRFREVQLVGSSRDNPYAWERKLPVYICRSPKFGSLAEFWPQLKRWR
jgi:Dolichyl-phosphate-mannose-protein mannosyltransferase